MAGFLYCSTCEEFSIDVSITNVGLILRKLRWYFQLFSSTNKNSILTYFKKKFKFFGFHAVVDTCRPFYWCINFYCKTDIDKPRVTSACQHKSKFNFYLFWKEIQIFGFPCCISRENLSIHVSITNVGLILLKMWFQIINTSQNSISTFFEKKLKFWSFPCCSTREDLSIDVSITNVGLILTKLWWFQNFGTNQNTY